MQTTQVKIKIPETIDPQDILGAQDWILRRIEDACSSLITVRGNQITLSGLPQDVHNITHVFQQLIEICSAHVTPTKQDVDALLLNSQNNVQHTTYAATRILTTVQGHPISPKTSGQKEYVHAIESHTITFGLGPAGTGKTYLAMAMALAALSRKEVSRIVLTRPVVEAGESLGFLPGTLEEKLDPYVRPLWDALFEMCGAERAHMYAEQGIIEIAPLAFMRGRTFNDAYVILDEAQNTSSAQMKMFLTRLGYNSKFVITGDISQRDMQESCGLESAREILARIDDIAFVDLHAQDIVRHSLVAKIVKAYNVHDGN